MTDGEPEIFTGVNGMTYIKSVRNEDEIEILKRQNESLSMLVGGVLKRVDKLESELAELQTVKKDLNKMKLDAIYQKNKTELEGKHYGGYIAVDLDEEKIIAIASTRVDVIENAKRKGDKEYFIRKVGKLPTLRPRKIK